MAWFKVDDRLWGHPKWLATPARARALWVTAGSWCSANLTDGFVPRVTLSILGGSPKDAQALVDAGLWTVEGDGWRFHQFLERNPSRTQVEAERKSAADRQQRARDRARESRRDDGVSNGPPDPTRPDPVLTIVSDDTQEVPHEVWREYGRLQRTRAGNIVKNSQLYEMAVTTKAKADPELVAKATRWLSDFNVTPREVAAALVDGKAGHTWTRREETA